MEDTEKLQPRSRNVNRIIFFLSFIGILVALYVLQSFIRKSSIICVTGNGCSAVRNSPASYIFGIPVPAFGLVGYAFLTVLAFLRSVSRDRRLLNGMLGIAVFGVCFVTWFTYVELFVIHGVCTWCLISTINMYAIFALVATSIRQIKHNKEAII